MSASKKNKNISGQKSPSLKKEQKPEKQKTIFSFLINALIGLLIVVACVWFTDSKGYFNPDYLNDHTRRKWNAYYDFTQRNDVDVVLVGNSHLYTGINPKNLSNTLGANCFILASPGTTLTDSYFALKEAITVKKPKIAIIETFTIDDYESRKLKDGRLVDQFKSFKARKNVPQKLYSTPILFASDNYVSAWSNTVRNHNFIFTDREQIKKNIELIKNPLPVDKRLYLGRYVRFTSGIEPETLAKYDEPGFRGFDGEAFTVSDEARKYIRKTVELCQENDIKLIFLTLPVYHRHIYDYPHMKEVLAQCLAPYNELWIDMQEPYDYEAFTTDAFENTTNANQHMTYYGSLVASYKLAHFIQDNLPGVLPDRSKDNNWIRLFYGDEGYFENHPVLNDGVNKTLMKNESIPGGLTINEIDLINRGSNLQLLVKINRQGAPDLAGKKVRVTAEITAGNNTFNAPLEAVQTYDYDPVDHYLFSLPLHNDVSINRITSVEVID